MLAAVCWCSGGLHLSAGYWRLAVIKPIKGPMYFDNKTALNWTGASSFAKPPGLIISAIIKWTLIMTLYFDSRTVTYTHAGDITSSVCHCLVATRSEFLKHMHSYNHQGMNCRCRTFLSMRKWCCGEHITHYVIFSKFHKLRYLSPTVVAATSSLLVMNIN